MTVYVVYLSTYVCVRALCTFGSMHVYLCTGVCAYVRARVSVFKHCMCLCKCTLPVYIN